MAEEIFMDVPEMRKVADQFTSMNESLSAVAKSMEAQIMVLRAAAMTGNVGAEAYRQWLESMKPRVERFAERCRVMNLQLKDITEAYEKGDMEGASAFTAVS
jgi:WXG100 family type VII secretion target